MTTNSSLRRSTSDRGKAFVIATACVRSMERQRPPQKDSSLRLLACGAWSASDRGNLPVSFIPSSSEFLTYLADLFSPCTQGLYSNQKADCHDPLPINAEDERLFGLAKGLAVTEQRGKAIGFVIATACVRSMERQRPRQSVRHCDCLRAEHGALASAAKDSSLRGSVSDRGNLPFNIQEDEMRLQRRFADSR